MLQLSPEECNLVIGGTGPTPIDDAIKSVGRVIVKGKSGHDYSVITDPLEIEIFLQNLLTMSIDQFSDLYDTVILFDDSSTVNDYQTDVEFLVHNAEFKKLPAHVQASFLNSERITNQLQAYLSQSNADGSLMTFGLSNTVASAYFDGKTIFLNQTGIASSVPYSTEEAAFIAKFLHELGHFANRAESPNYANLSDSAYVYERAKGEIRANEFAINAYSEIIRADLNMSAPLTQSVFGYVISETQLSWAKDGFSYSLSATELDALTKRLVGMDRASTGAANATNWDGDGDGPGGGPETDTPFEEIR